jgi:hypothetical protein
MRDEFHGTIGNGLPTTDVDGKFEEATGIGNPGLPHQGSFNWDTKHPHQFTAGEVYHLVLDRNDPGSRFWDIAITGIKSGPVVEFKTIS